MIWTSATTIILLFFLPNYASGFSNAPKIFSVSARRRHHQQQISLYSCAFRQHSASPRGPRRISALKNAAATTDDDAATIDSSSDPFQILGIPPTTDKKVIKRAYKRRALQFHPDVAAEGDKKTASDRFAKINGAYQSLTGGSSSNVGSSNAGGTASSSTGGYTPPHRRSGAYTNENASTDWRDYIPNNYSDEDDEQYDTDGDSFSKIFSDLFAGAAVGAAGVAGNSAGILYDFIEFLEGNVDGFGGSGFGGASSGSDEYDSELQVLLRTGSLDDVANEMDDTTLVVEQLQAKAINIDDEILTTNAEAKMTSKYMEKVELEEKVAELKARKGVIDNYLKKSQSRLLALQKRYKDLITSGSNDSYAGGGRRGSSSSSSYSSPPPPASTSSSTQSPSSSSTTREGFGSSGRSRGSGRRRTARRGSTTSSTPSDAANTNSTPPPPPPPSSTAPPPRTERATSSSSTTSSSPYSSRESIRPRSNTDSSVPPHRRTSKNYESSAEENKRRMREMKVDEEFEKLKKELGM